MVGTHIKSLQAGTHVEELQIDMVPAESHRGTQEAEEKRRTQWNGVKATGDHKGTLKNLDARWMSEPTERFHRLEGPATEPCGLELCVKH